MSKAVKSSKEVLDEFITSISENKKLDKDTVATITELYKTNKLSSKNLSNALAALREKGDSNDQNK